MFAYAGMTGQYFVATLLVPVINYVNQVTVLIVCQNSGVSCGPSLTVNAFTGPTIQCTVRIHEGGDSLDGGTGQQSYSKRLRYCVIKYGKWLLSYIQNGWLYVRHCTYVQR